MKTRNFLTICVVVVAACFSALPMSLRADEAKAVTLHAVQHGQGSATNLQLAGGRVAGGVVLGHGPAYYRGWYGWGPGFYGPYWGPYYGWYYYPGASGNKGEVKFKSDDPTTKVYINGSYAGLAKELKSVWLRAGSYNLELRGSNNQVYKERIYVIANKTLKINPGFQSSTPSKK